jgi:hypothetical protein
LWPLAMQLLDNFKKVAGSISTSPLVIVKHITRSYLRRRNSSVLSDNSTRRSTLHNDERQWIDYAECSCYQSTNQKHKGKY